MNKEESLGRFEVIQGGISDDAVVDFEVEQAERTKSASEIVPTTLLKMAVLEAQSDPNIEKAYITMLRKNEDGTFTTINFRCGMDMVEELAYRQVGVTEAIDRWRGDGP